MVRTTSLAIALLLAAAALPCHGQTSAEELEKRLLVATGTERVDTLNRLSFHLKSSRPRLSLEYADQALTHSRDLGYDLGEVSALKNLGLGHYFLAEYDQAMVHYRESLELARAIDSQRDIADVANNMGILYYVWGMYDEALEHYFISLEIRQRSGDRGGMARAFNNIAGVHHSLGEPKKALPYYNQSLALYEELGERELVASTLNNIGLVLKEMDRTEEALEHYQRALDIEQGLDDPSGLALALHNVGTILDQRGDLEGALAYYRRALTIRDEIGDRQGAAFTSMNIGTVLSKQGQPDDAMDSLERALDLALEINVPELLRDVLLALTEACAAAGDYRRALEYHRQHTATDRVIFDRERTRTAAELQTRFEVEKKDQEIEVLRRDRQIQRLVRDIVLIVTALLALILFLLYNRYRLRVRSNRAIERRNAALEEARAELELSLRSQLTHVSRVATMGELAAGFAHELNQPLAAIMANARAAQRFLAEASDPAGTEAREAVSDIAEGTVRAGEIIRRLRQLIRRGEISAESLSLNDTIRGIESFLRGEAELAHIPLELELAEGLPEVFADCVQLQQVVLNLVQNGVSAMAGPPRVEGSLTLRTSYDSSVKAVVVSLEDAGPPLDNGVLEQMFEPFYTTKSDGLGMGLRICRTIVEAHGGRLWATQNPSRGLTVQFAIPVQPVGE